MADAASARDVRDLNPNADLDNTNTVTVTLILKLRLAERRTCARRMLGQALEFVREPEAEAMKARGEITSDFAARIRIRASCDPTWWKLPLVIALLYLAATRNQLEEHNLYDTYLPGELPVKKCDGVNLAARTLDGTCNELKTPAMGSLGTRFGRYVPIDKSYGENETTNLYTPNPRTISQQLFKRETFTPAPSINLLAAAWIQFQVHDWFSHDPVNDPDNYLTFPLPANDPLRATGQNNMSIRRTVWESHPGRPNTFNNINTHWWDLSPVYGQDSATNAKVRSFIDGKLNVAGDGLLPVGPDGLDITGFNDNWWAGLSMMHNIWTKEHNYVCDMLKASNPMWNDQQLYDHARLITTALNAKIHTVEWTPALLQDKILLAAMNANWYGLAPEWLQDLVPDLHIFPALSEAWYGIVGGEPNFDGVAFSHSEEFVSVYRFHSLLRDSITIRNHSDGADTANTYDIHEYTFGNAQNVIHDNSFADVVYTFGVDNPGALILHNYPDALLSLNKPGVPYTLDMGAVDVLRDRERGVPRYNEFRRLFLLKPAKTMDDISDDAATVAALRSVYGEDVEAVDLMAGCLAESPRATGFAFSNTQFQVFILAASRRLLTDRFFTTDYTAAVYTQQGLDYIQNSDFRAVIGRNIPELNASVYTVDNAFKPWKV
ncbi:heme peroxidase-domain-containing protein [Mycena pura]|uniref:Heme peroxidase-domain-containing protein n=1 Tax=Mycena pura TaxID=153505 RepID=A0AAD6YRS0_9AGAR|nr:heme peroxidase-domain-containing protein [Mycena pura]